MSNVLIGIIGVILFIGLALAGALFLGPRFQSATNSSKASAAIQATKQVADAAHLYALSEGTVIGFNGGAELVSKGYLKSVPKVGEANASVLNDTGCAGCSTGTPSGIGYFLGTDANAKSVCEAIMRQTGQLASDQPFDPISKSLIRGQHSTPSGCSRIGSEYYVFTFI